MMLTERLRTVSETFNLMLCQATFTHSIVTSLAGLQRAFQRSPTKATVLSSQQGVRQPHDLEAS
jgi:hypothetical protein